MGSQEDVVIPCGAVAEGLGYRPGWKFEIDFIGIKRACVYVPAKRNVHRSLPKEDH